MITIIIVPGNENRLAHVEDVRRDEKMQIHDTESETSMV